jgi:hypothetical protein
VAIKRAFVALKSSFKILHKNPFHTFPIHVKLGLACCIIHNSILGWGIDGFFPDEIEVIPNEVDGGHEFSDTTNGGFKRLVLPIIIALALARQNSAMNNYAGKTIDLSPFPLGTS